MSGIACDGRSPADGGELLLGVLVISLAEIFGSRRADARLAEAFARPEPPTVSFLPKPRALPPLAAQIIAMDDPLASIPEPYAGLNVHSADIFPLACTRCQRRFSDLHDFISRTTPIFHSTGLMEREDAAGTFVLLLRNCLCGTSLALRCLNRRSRSDRGAVRRSRFDTLVGLLVEVGVEPEQARAEIRRLLQATEV